MITYHANTPWRPSSIEHKNISDYVLVFDSALIDKPNDGNIFAQLETAVHKSKAQEKIFGILLLHC